MDNEKKTNWNIRPYLAMGLTAFIVIAAAIIFFFFIDRYSGASKFMSLVIKALQPILVGVFLGYLLNPLVNRIQDFIKKHSVKGKKCGKWLTNSARGIGIVIAMALLIFAVVLLVWLIGPQLYTTIEGLIVTLPSQAKSTVNWLKDVVQQNDAFEKYAETIITEVTVFAQNFLKTEVIPRTKDIVTQVTGGILVIAKGLINFIIGMIVCIYVLIEKDHFKGIFKKALYAFFPTRAANSILKTARKSDKIFGGFLVGKIIDSIIIGILTYIVLLIFRIPYPVLVSVIVGVTNVIPFFGPYIGAVPSLLLVLLASPIKALYFLIILIVIQQIDGNIIGPKILGNSTGLSSFWVVFAIMLFGGVFGFWGMLFGVPVFGVIYYIIDGIAEYFLRKKNMPLHSEQYNDIDTVEPETHKITNKE
ncbi:MAG: AI-2E family transporter [Lachnospiraceae bacterium]|nr:AI-2E family transporter [Lachnospiraceae bacterium]